MKKFLSGVLAVFTLLVLGCNSGSTNVVKSVYIKAQNEEIFSKQDAQNIYYCDTNKNDKLIMSAVINQAEGIGIINRSHKARWEFQYCDQEKLSIDNFCNYQGEPIASCQQNNLIIDISKIDKLGSYTVFATAGGIEGKYTFEVDSTLEFDTALKIYYVPEIGAQIADENQVVLNKNSDITLSCSTTYAIVTNSNLGSLEYENSTPEAVFLSHENGDVEQKFVSKEKIVYLTTGKKEGENGIIKVRAGNKKQKEYRINTQASHCDTIAMDAPKAQAVAVVGGYKVIFSSNDLSIFDNYSLMLEINGENPIRVVDKYYDADGNFAGVFYSFTQVGYYDFKAYFQKENTRSNEFSNIISIYADAESANLFGYDNVIYRYKSPEENCDNVDEKNIENIKITIPYLANYYAPNPFGEGEETCFFRNARLRITVKADDIQHYDIPLNYSGPTEWIYKIKNSIRCDKITFDFFIYNCKGSFHSYSYSKTIPVNRFDAKANFKYYQDSETNNKAFYSLTISEQKIISSNASNEAFRSTYIKDEDSVPKKSTLQVCVSEDGGRNFFDVYEFPINLDDKDTEYKIPKAYLKNSTKVIMTARIMCDLWVDKSLGMVTTANMMCTNAAEVDFSQEIQDAPNVKKAKIVAPAKTGYEIEYLVNNSSYPAANDLWTKVNLKDGEAIIDAIKYKKGDAEQKVVKTLWVKTIDLINKSAHSAISSYTITLLRAPKSMENKSDGYLWRNTGFWGKGITLTIHAPVDNCYIKTIAESENASANGLYYFKKKDDSKQVLNDWDQCFAAYRYNRFYIVCYTSMAGYIDSEIEMYSGWERSGENSDYRTYNDRAQKAAEKLKNKWRCVYEF